MRPAKKQVSNESPGISRKKLGRAALISELRHALFLSHIFLRRRQAAIRCLPSSSDESCIRRGGNWFSRTSRVPPQSLLPRGRPGNCKIATRCSFRCRRFRQSFADRLGPRRRRNLTSCWEHSKPRTSIQGFPSELLFVWRWVEPGLPHCSRQLGRGCQVASAIQAFESREYLLENESEKQSPLRYLRSTRPFANPVTDIWQFKEFERGRAGRRRQLTCLHHAASNRPLVYLDKLGLMG